MDEKTEAQGGVRHGMVSPPVSLGHTVVTALVRGWVLAPSCPSKLAVTQADGPDTSPPPSGSHSFGEQQLSNIPPA